MSFKGNDLVRGYLWNAAQCAIVHNPVIRRCYARQKKMGKRGDVALGHCMQKLLHLVFAIWKSGKPFVAPAEEESEPSTSVPAQVADSATSETAAGRTEQGSERQAVTAAAPSIVNAPTASSQPLAEPCRYVVDFAELRRQIRIEQVLREAQWLDCLRARGQQLRGPCPIHDTPQSRSRSFSVNVHKNVFHCFDASCGAHGNALDLWSQIRKLPLYEAARDLAERLGLQQRNREEEPVKEPVATA
jgi:hypothetical protein